MDARAMLLTLMTCLTAAACDDTQSCQDKGCEPQYTAHLEGPEPELEVGLWRVELQVDGGEISAECFVPGPNEGPESIACELSEWTNEPEGALEVFVTVNTRIGPGSGEPTDSGDPPEMSNQGIFVTVVSGAGQAPVQTLDATVLFEDELVFETQRSPTFEVIEDFGGVGCGSCLRDVTEVVALPPASD